MVSNTRSSLSAACASATAGGTSTRSALSLAKTFTGKWPTYSPSVLILSEVDEQSCHAASGVLSVHVLLVIASLASASVSSAVISSAASVEIVKVTERSSLIRDVLVIVAHGHLQERCRKL